MTTLDEPTETANTSAAPAFPPLAGRHVRLRAPGTADYDWLYQLATSEQVGIQWRLRGTVISPHAFVEFLWKDTLAQMVIETSSSSERIGLVQLINADLHHGYAYISYMLTPDAQKRGWPLESIALFINYAFVVWNLRKLYFESSEIGIRHYQSAIGRLLIEEGHLDSHEHFDGRYIDNYIFAMYRTTWVEKRERIAAILGRSS